MSDTRLIEHLRQRVLDLETENAILKAIDRGDLPSANWWATRKAERQRAALDTLCRKVTSQRFVLRTINELGRGLTAEEFAAAKAKANEQLQERLDETAIEAEPVAALV